MFDTYIFFLKNSYLSCPPQKSICSSAAHNGLCSWGLFRFCSWNQVWNLWPQANPCPIRLRLLKSSQKLRENERGKQACIFIKADLCKNHFCLSMDYLQVISKWFKSSCKVLFSSWQVQCCWEKRVQSQDTRACFYCWLGRWSAGGPWVNHITSICLSPHM